MVIRRISRLEWYNCGDVDSFHDFTHFDIETEKCEMCGMDIDTYWVGYSRELSGLEGRGGDSYRIRRATARARLTEEMHAQEGENSSGPKRPERAYLFMGLGE